MGIILEKRDSAQQPAVRTTDYGAKYVEAAKESPVEEAPANIGDNAGDVNAPAPEEPDNQGGLPAKEEAPANEEAPAKEDSPAQEKKTAKKTAKGKKSSKKE